MRQFIERLWGRQAGSNGRRARARRARRRRLNVDALESRRMLAVTVDFTNGHLDVDGDSMANDIAVTFQDVSGTDYVIVKDGATTVFDGTPTGQDVETSEVTSIDVAAAGDNDTIDLSDVNTSNGFSGLDDAIDLFGGDGSDSIVGSSFADLLSANSGNDTMEGGTGDDTLISGTGNDSMSGGTGNDSYVFLRGSATQSLGSDTLTDGTGGSNDAGDLLSFSAYLEGITLDLSSTSAQAINPDLTITLNASDAFEAALGSTLADTITGNSRDNTLVGDAGDDTISAADGADTLVGNAGADSITAGAGADIIIGGTGDDTLTGGTGDDLYGFGQESSEHLGSDTLTEGTGGSNDALDILDFSDADVAVTIDLSSTSAQNWGGGTITLNATDSFEVATGSAFNDSLTGNSRDNVLGGEAGNDLLDGGSSGDDTLDGGGGDDTLIGGTGADSLTGGTGADRYEFGADAEGSDTLTEAANVDTDTLWFAFSDVDVTIDLSSTSAQNWGDGTITLSSATGFEDVFGSGNDDTITGNARSNKVVAGEGNDTVNTGLGDDDLQGNEGNDSLTGGAGSDTYRFDPDPQGSDTLTEAANVDSDALFFAFADVGVTIDLSSTSAQSWGDGTITLSSASGFEDVFGSGNDDTITGNDRDNDIIAGLGNDSVTAGAGSDLIMGNEGNDTLVGGAGDDFYVFDSDPQGTDTITEAASAGDDSVVFEDSDVAVTFDLSSTSAQSWGDGTITLSDAAGIEFLVGSGQNDTLTGNALDNIILGLGGNDSISGAAGRDILIGGVGADTILGGDGDDILVAGDIDYGGNEFSALTDVRDEWTSGNSYQDRVDNILKGLPDPSPIPTASQFDPGTTVLDDSDVDSLVGGNGTDWFLDDPDEDSNDVAGGEIETDIDV